ncbi:zinc metalloprotease HtpX [Sulfurimonas sp. HSL-3221]|uniref:zinc metalloprotease HtpX n=1 Tax=Sulfurimonadaceae TaxID=2771471 RepID=UPI001E50253E|nr:zinc metalloprotease HtpX [Sulfurimonas sp. HSL-3221]UFS61301.1 zinc metalloprotease HtpX [Sulfurimonas sp. HSL-3221]
MEQIKTVFLLSSLAVLFVMLGGYFGGMNGALIGLLLAGGMNFYAYFYSDKMLLRHYHAEPGTPEQNPRLYRIISSLAHKADLPVPAMYIIHEQTPNAFATGRDPAHAAVAITEGLLQMLDDEEVEAVMAHELSHVKHRDMLIATVAASIAGAIAMIANMMQFGAMFGNNRGRNPIVMIALALLLPLAASVIQMTISRSREFMADAGSARITGHPEWLQRALRKLETYNTRGSVQGATPENAHLFIVSPFAGKRLSFGELFRTHPTTEQRIARLELLKSGESPKHFERHYR